MTAGRVSHGAHGQPGWIDEALREHTEDGQKDAPGPGGRRQLPLA